MSSEVVAGPKAAIGSSRLFGKSTVITGAAKGIGRATAELFALEGARIVAGDIDADGLNRLCEHLESQGAMIAAVVGDVSKPEDARSMVEAAIERYGRLDVLGGECRCHPSAEHLTRATPEDWDEVMAVDGRGMFLCCKYAIEEMLKTGGGSIVCLSSISGVAGQKISRPTGRRSSSPQDSRSIWPLSWPTGVSASTPSRRARSRRSACYARRGWRAWR